MRGWDGEGGRGVGYEMMPVPDSPGIAPVEVGVP